jgi:hypothetical protein
MASIGAGSSPRNGSAELRSSAGMFRLSQRRPHSSPPQAGRARPLRLPACTEPAAAGERALNRRKRDGCSESFVFSVLACSGPADALQTDPSSRLPLRQTTRHTMSSKVRANLLKTNNGCTHQVTHNSRGAGRVRFRGTWISNRQLPLLECGSSHRKQTTTLRSNRQLLGVPRFRHFPISRFHFLPAITESRPARAASDSHSGGTT